MLEGLENSLMILEIERNQTELRLKEQMKSIRYRLDMLESKLESKEEIYESDGLQGNAINIDVYLNKLVVYENAIGHIKNHINEVNKECKL